MAEVANHKYWAEKGDGSDSEEEEEEEEGFDDSSPGQGQGQYPGRRDHNKDLQYVAGGHRRTGGSRGSAGEMQGHVNYDDTSDNGSPGGSDEEDEHSFSPSIGGVTKFHQQGRPRGPGEHVTGGAGRRGQQQQLTPGQPGQSDHTGQVAPGHSVDAVERDGGGGGGWRERREKAGGAASSSSSQQTRSPLVSFTSSPILDDDSQAGGSAGGGRAGGFRRSTSKMLPKIEKLHNLRSAAEGLMTKLYRMRKVLDLPAGVVRTTDSVWKSGVVPDFPKLCMYVTRKFPEHPRTLQLEKVDKAGLEIVKGMCEQFRAALEPWYLVLVDVLVFKELALKMLHDMSASLGSLSANSNSLVLHAFMELFCNFVRVNLLTLKTGRKMIVQVYALLYHYSTSGGEPEGHHRLLHFVDVYDPPLEGMQEDLAQVGSRVGEILEAISPTLRRLDDLQRLRTDGFMSPFHSWQEELPPPPTHGASREVANMEAYRVWVLYGYLACPAELLHGHAADILAAELKNTYLVPLFRDEVIYIHDEYQQYVLPKIVDRGKMAKAGRSRSRDLEIEYRGTRVAKKRITDALEVALATMEGLHKQRRVMLKQELSRLLLLFADQPGLLPPVILMVFGLLSLARAEVEWYFEHAGVVAARPSAAGNGASVSDFAIDIEVPDSTVGCLLDQIFRMTSLVRKYSAAVRGHAMARLRDSLQRVGTLLTTERFASLDMDVGLRRLFQYLEETLVAIIVRMEGLERAPHDGVALVALADQVSWQHFRDYWFNISTFVASARSKVNAKQLEEATCVDRRPGLNTECNLAYLWSRNADSLTELLEEHASLKTLCYYQPQLVMVFRQTMFGPDACPQQCLSWLGIATSFPQNSHRSVPAEEMKLRKAAVDYADRLLDAVMSGLDALVGTIDSQGGLAFLDQKVQAVEAVELMNLARSAPNLAKAGGRRHLDVPLPGQESEPGRFSEIQGLENALHRLTGLVAAINALEPVQVAHEAFVPREYLRERVAATVRARIREALLLPDGALQRPTLFEAAFRRCRQIVHIIEHHTALDLTSVIREVLLSEAYGGRMRDLHPDAGATADGADGNGNGDGKYGTAIGFDDGERRTGGGGGSGGAGGPVVERIAEWYLENVVLDVKRVGVVFAPLDGAFRGTAGGGGAQAPPAPPAQPLGAAPSQQQQQASGAGEAAAGGGGSSSSSTKGGGSVAAAAASATATMAAAMVTTTDLAVDVAELEALVRVFGPYAVDRIARGLREHVHELLTRFEGLLRANRATLNALPQKLHVAEERAACLGGITDLELGVALCTQIGHCLSLQHLLAEAAGGVLAAHVPLVHTVLRAMARSLPSGAPESRHVSRAKRVAARAGAVAPAADDTSADVLELLLDIGGVGDSSWSLLPYLFAAFMTSDVWRSAAFNPATGGFSNNIHCLSRSMHTIMEGCEKAGAERRELKRTMMAQQRISAMAASAPALGADDDEAAGPTNPEAVQRTIQSMMKTFVQCSACIVLSEWETCSRGSLAARFIFLDQLCEASAYLPRSALELHVPYCMIRSAYQAFYDDALRRQSQTPGGGLLEKGPGGGPILTRYLTGLGLEKWQGPTVGRHLSRVMSRFPSFRSHGGGAPEVDSLSGGGGGRSLSPDRERERDRMRSRSGPLVMTPSSEKGSIVSASEGGGVLFPRDRDYHHSGELRPAFGGSGGSGSFGGVLGGGGGGGGGGGSAEKAATATMKSTMRAVSFLSGPLVYGTKKIGKSASKVLSHIESSVTMSVPELDLRTAALSHADAWAAAAAPARSEGGDTLLRRRSIDGNSNDEDDTAASWARGPASNFREGKLGGDRESSGDHKDKHRGLPKPKLSLARYKSEDLSSQLKRLSKSGPLV